METLCPPGGLCDTLGVWLAAILTILVFTYLIHDTVLFRIASCLLVGTAIGFVSAVTIRTALLPLAAGLAQDVVTLPDSLVVFVFVHLLPAILGLSLLLKLAPNLRGNTVSNLGLAYLFGIGAALAISGALAGALVPQLANTIVSLAPQGTDPGWFNNVLIVIGTLGAFLTFRFIQPGNRPYQRIYDSITTLWGTVGRGFIMIAFGAILATLITARVSALVGQLYFIFHKVLGLVK